MTEDAANERDEVLDELEIQSEERKVLSRQEARFISLVDRGCERPNRDYLTQDDDPVPKSDVVRQRR